VKWIDEVLEIALTEQPVPVGEEKVEAPVEAAKSGSGKKTRRKRLTTH